ncbi:C-reactive protein [Manis pentadactyla]|uniref:C-reactive protein n=1 Tax=Manis pentadactyla TaxID=143292 RepID=UPI001876B44E|nr:C-reactive protein [Manis pentadactyla]
MEKLWLCFLLVLSLPSAFSQRDLWRKAFVFPKESDNSFVTLSAQLQEPLRAFTLCLHVYTDLTRGYSIFSYATRTQPNEILFFKENSGVYSVAVGGAAVVFKPPALSPAPLHMCVTWESVSGIVELWVDGKPMVRRSLRKGYSVGTEASIILGQEQDSFAGSFDKNQSLVGDIGDVNMWDSVLSPDEISTIYAGGKLNPNVLNWGTLKFEEHGEVFIKTQLWP